MTAPPALPPPGERDRPVRWRPVWAWEWTLRQRLIAVCGLAAMLVGLLAAAAAVSAAANRGELDALLDDVGPMRVAANDLLSAVTDQDSGVRGYVLSGRLSDLAPYTQGIAAERHAVSAIEANPAATPEVIRELGAAHQLTAQWQALVAEPAIDLMQTRGPDSAQAFLNGQVTDAFDRVRAAVLALQQSIQRIRDAAVTDLRDSSSGLVALLLVAAAVVMVGGVALIVLLQRLVTGPVTVLAGQVRTVAAGRYDQGIAPTGPPELRRLAGDVDAMRRQIVTDLAEVRRSRRLVEEINARLESQAAELTRSNRDLEQFAYVASHDLQEPLRKVTSFCQLLQRRYAGQLDERADEYIAFAVNGAQRMQRLINDLLAFSRIGRAGGGFAEVDLDAVLADVVGHLDLPVPASVTWDRLPTVRGNEPLLATLLANLLGNSVKFSRPGEPTNVHLSARRVDDLWEISCCDNGIGIEPEFADKVFVIFQRLHARDAYPGTGIGLAIAKKIVEYHGGTIWVEPGQAAGTTIRLTLTGHPVTIGPGLASPDLAVPDLGSSNLDPADVDPPVMEPPVLEPPVVEPAVVEPAVVEPAVVEPAVLEPPMLEPAVLEPADGR